MRRSAAILSTDTAIVSGLKAVLSELGISQTTCHSCHEAMELITKGRCSTLIVDFDVPGAHEVVKMGALLDRSQKPALLAIGNRAWPGTGQAFQSGADRILYKPLDPAQVKEALEASQKLQAKNRRKVPRHEMKTVVYFELDRGTLPAIGIDISEHGFAVQATEPVPMLSKMAFRCVLPGTSSTLHGQADVIWASDHGRAGLFFSRLAPSARKLLKQWLRKRSALHRKDAARGLLAPADVVGNLSPCLVTVD